MSDFVVGDIVTGKPGSYKAYGVTNEEMTAGIIEKINQRDGGIYVRVLEHKWYHSNNPDDDVYWVKAKYFEKVTSFRPSDDECSSDAGGVKSLFNS